MTGARNKHQDFVLTFKQSSQQAPMPTPQGSTTPSSYVLQKTTPDWTQLKFSGLPVKKAPKGILAFDIDETLYNNKKNAIHNKLKIQNLIQKALRNNILIVAVTARDFISQEMLMSEGAKVKAVYQVIQEIHPNAFRFIYFTGNKSKKDVLETLEKEFATHLVLSTPKICLIDDQDRFLDPCAKAGFTTIKVDTENKYLDAIEKYIDTLSQLYIFEIELYTTFGAEKLAALVKKHAAITGHFLWYVREILSILENADEKTNFLHQINIYFPDLILEACKGGFQEVVKFLLPDYHNEVWQQLDYLIVNKLIPPYKLDRLFKEINGNIGFLKDAQNLLSQALSTNNIDNAIIIIKHLENHYNPENLQLLALENNRTIKHYYLKYLIIQYIKDEKNKVATNCYQPGWFSGSTRSDKIKAADVMLSCLDKDTPLTDKTTMATIAGSNKLAEIYSKVKELLPQKPVSVSESSTFELSNIPVAFPIAILFPGR